MGVVARGGEDVGGEHVAVRRQRGPHPVVDRRAHRLLEPVVLLLGPGCTAELGVFDEQIELHDGRLDEPGHRRATGSGPFPMALRRGGQQRRQGAQPGEVAVAALLGVELELGQRRQDAGHRRDEGVADRELGQGDLRRVGHAPRQHPHEVERLVLGLTEAALGVLLGAPGDRLEGGAHAVFPLHAQVGQAVVEAGEAVERPGERVGVENGGEELGGQVISGHGAPS